MRTEKLTAKILSSVSKLKPDTAIILGTGLGIIEEEISIDKAINYNEIPRFARSSVKGHTGRLLFGTLSGYPVIVMSGRFHLYEGYTAEEITFPIRVFRMMGIKRLLISNAAGGLRQDLKPGSIMMITDHINLTSNNPLVGPNKDKLGPRFPDMSKPYSPQLMNMARNYARGEKIELKEGVYVQILGPSLETAAETRMLKIIGADAVGMSTVIEVIQAVHCGMEVIAISAITNFNDPDNYKPSSIEEIIKLANKAGPTIAEIFTGILGDKR